MKRARERERKVRRGAIFRRWTLNKKGDNAEHRIDYPRSQRAKEQERDNLRDQVSLSLFSGCGGAAKQHLSEQTRNEAREDAKNKKRRVYRECILPPGRLPDQPQETWERESGRQRLERETEKARALLLRIVINHVIFFCYVSCCCWNHQDIGRKCSFRRLGKTRNLTESASSTEASRGTIIRR